MKNSEMRIKEKSEIKIFFQELSWRDREIFFFFWGGGGRGGLLFLEINSLTFGKFQEVKVRFNEFV